MRKIFTLFLLLHIAFAGVAQTPKTWASSEILLNLRKLNVLGSVLYVAAHPDDENTGLLAWLAKEKLYRAGYLSVTRGDGGQNLIGDEQGIELGLIRTQELLSARRIDGAEQFFTRGYDFGFSKSTEEALKLWDKEKVLSDMVWVIRKFQPDVIITRFPEDARAGHGQHSASAVLAREAFTAAADPNRYPEQFKYGVKPWKATRIMWNTFNFGSNNTITKNQFNVDIGGFNPLTGKSYGETEAESRGQHKSQGFGFFSSRGKSLEYFVPLSADSAKVELLDGVKADWTRVPNSRGIESQVNKLIKKFSVEHPERSVPALVSLYKSISSLNDNYWKQQKLKEVQQLIEACSGLYIDATTTQELAVQGDSLKVSFSIDNRAGVAAELTRVQLEGSDTSLSKALPINEDVDFSKTILITNDKPLTQPYWLRKPMMKGSFVVDDQEQIGKPENDPSIEASFTIKIANQLIVFKKPVMYKFRHPVKGEVFEPLVVAPAVRAEVAVPLQVLTKSADKSLSNQVKYIANKNISNIEIYEGSKEVAKENGALKRQQSKIISLPLNISSRGTNGSWEGDERFNFYLKPSSEPLLILRKIQYDHIPYINYFTNASVRNLYLDVKTDGKKIGYIKGAGDKVPEALSQLGYDISFLEEKDMRLEILSQFDAIVTGIRAYNVHEWMNAANETLMEYVKNGGNVVVQYNTNNFAGQLRAKIGPYPFVITGKRVTDEEAKVNFTSPADSILNWPNKITDKDFDGWIQERGVYFAEQLSPQFKTVISMKDPGEQDQVGSLIVANYGTGRFIYTGLAFFRQLPAGVPGAYRLFANLISNPNHKN